MAVKNIKCPGCGAAMRFDAKLGKLKCDNCDITRDIDERTASELWGNVDDSVNWMDWGDFNPEDDCEKEVEEGTILYSCPSCGAEIEVDTNTTATKCPYCDNNVVIKDRVKGVKKPHAVIPFKIEKKQVPQLLNNFFSKKKFLPGAFRSQCKVENIKGVYVPYWLFNCNIDGTMDFRGKIVRRMETSDYVIIHTDHFLLKRAGELYFDRVPVDGSVGLDDKLTQSIEPYDYSQLVPYDDRYLSGFMAEKYDEQPVVSMQKASKRMMNTAGDYLSRNEHYMGVSLVDNNMRVHDANAQYVLLPVYLFDVSFGGKNYRFAINGQTGKVVGDVPISYGKMALAAGGIALGVGAAAAAIAPFVLGIVL